MTPMRYRNLSLFLFILIVITLQVSNVNATTIQNDKTVTVSTVIDGSSFTLNSGETVKLACIYTPQQGQPGYDSAKNYLTSIILGKIVYLTVDNITKIDLYGRLLCVAYSNYNSTHYQNVNMAMIESNYAIATDANGTEFNPTQWSWFVPINNQNSPTTVLTPTPTSTSNIPTYSPPAMPTPSPVLPEFTALMSFFIISFATLILFKIRKKS